MPRPLRIEFENAWYHILNRGVNRQTIFKFTLHRTLLCELQGEITERFKIEIHILSNEQSLPLTPLGYL